MQSNASIATYFNAVFLTHSFKNKRIFMGNVTLRSGRFGKLSYVSFGL